ncbi:MAG: sugar phosphate isomerase/epimerase [Oscillospiraceae bacterium]|nr:sugar phosphate isomerase/epimerase [Oscillospiraceae bacterium]
MYIGLVSVTFRHLSPRGIVELVQQAGLDGIEWGADVHCPPGQLETAREIAALMAEHGLMTLSYGSYYQTGTFDPFDSLLDTAEILGTSNIRVWAGSVASALATAENWRCAVEDSQRIAGLAAERGISVSFEYHCDTLTDSIGTTERLLAETNRDNVFSYWQPPAGLSLGDNITAIQRLIKLKKLKSLHVSSFDGTERVPLEANGEAWALYIKEASSANPSLLLEFVKDDNPGQMLRDAAFLRSLICR